MDVIAQEEFLLKIDAWLNVCQGRELFSQTEVSDLLLDLRLLVTTPSVPEDVLV